MELVKNVINSINLVEYNSKVDNLIFSLLYSKETGYYSLKSKVAIEKYNYYIEKFNFELQKLNEEYNIQKLNDNIAFKQKEYLNKLNIHYKNQVVIWAKEVYERSLENLLFKVSLNKNDKNMCKFLYNKAHELTNWFFLFINSNKNEQKRLKLELENNYNKALNSSFSDYLPLENPIKSDIKTYLKLRNLFKTSKDEFSTLDLTKYYSTLSKNDLNYFNYLYQNAKTFKAQEITDEISLVDCAVEILNIKNDDEIYEFIQSVKDDILNFISANKKITEEDKISLIKRRMKLFNDLKDKKSSKSGYFKKVLVNEP